MADMTDYPDRYNTGDPTVQDWQGEPAQYLAWLLAEHTWFCPESPYVLGAIGIEGEE